MNKKTFVSLVTLILFLTVLAPAGSILAQRAQPRPANDVLQFLPASDAVAIVNVRRVISEALPIVLAADPAKLAQINTDIAKFKTRTGIDPLSLDRVVLGMRYTYPSPNITKVQTVAVARGTFDPKAVAAAGRAASGARYREEKYRGATISIFNLNDQIKLAGLWDLKIGELAICVLEPNTLLLGTLENVRAALTVGKAGAGSNQALAALASRDPNELAGFGANVTRALLDNLHVGTDTVAKDVGSIKQVYGSVGKTQTDLSLLIVARTGTPAEAKSVSETVTGLKQLGGIFIARMQPAKKKVAQGALDGLKITIAGTEVQISTQLATADLAAFIK